MASDSEKLTGALGLASLTGGSISKDKVKEAVCGYEQYHAQYGGDAQGRKALYADMVNKYYDLATSFYEYGWGESFHFAHRHKNETLRESIRRHQHYLALRLGLKPGMKVLDVGCGIGGPLREIAIFSGASITGLNNNQFQVARGTALNKAAGLDKTCDYLKADFMKMPIADSSYDAAYAIEATCHAPSPVECYREICRVLKPGQCFAGYEWCVTDAYNADDPVHRKCKEDIEIGDGLPDLQSCSQCVEALKGAGFEVIMTEDLAKSSAIPWYYPLARGFGLSEFRLTSFGRFFTRRLVWLLETLRVAPVGTTQVSRFLETASHGLVAGGKREIFTPMFFFLVRKPAKAAS
ncbi:hypothetical protein CBR_g10856 [Chara braunii]|uniref:Methyltransferase n=1 Tax=Chara braunii TaxID=69332 RepID=A0A388KPC9_CHABU|nr:hypothetical protein CBR_g10856 [Chara braunii]|eukprot:GBG71920.1 hypothetical protein CBR_g10856 [Chara braunii]